MAYIDNLQDAAVQEFNETTCNVGIISGGQMINIVPEACTIQGEVRGYNHDKVMEQVSAIRKQLAKVSQSHAASYEFSYNIHLHSYETEEKAPVIRRFQQVCQKLGLPGTLTETFGGSDQNPLSQHGINGIVLSNGMNKMHTTSEYTTIEDLKQGSLLAAQLILEED